MVMDYPLIKVVGVSASGKSTLVRSLRQAGYNARPVSQEHSEVATLWQQLDRPLYLIYLDTTLEAQQARRPDVSWQADDLTLERARLAQAQAQADLQINTTELSGETVFKIALAFLEHQGVRHAEQPLPPLAPTGSARVEQVETTSPEPWSKAVARRKRRAKKGR
jgi:energy-coupling factor transporter ATP-binding protein EcfA2